MKMSNACCLEIAEKFLIPHSLRDTYRIIADEAVQLVDGKYSSIFLYSHGKMERIYTSHNLLYSIYPRKNGVTMEVYTTRKPIVRSIANIIKILPASEKIYRKLDVTWDINVPLTYHNKIFGVLSVLGKQQFDEKNVRKLELFSHIATLAIQEVQSREKLKKAIKGRDFFLSLAAHELKTPLTSVSIYTGMLSPEKTNDQTVFQLKESVKRLTSLTNGLFDIDRIKRGTMKFDMQEFSLNKLISFSVKSFQDIHNDFPITFLTNLDEDKDHAYGDENKLIYPSSLSLQSLDIV